MSKISLRDYNHEIETLINSGKTDEAIAHCKYILQLFPKCVDTYRLLGKAYLEAQRYSEATDILTRILSVVPDDFVSQIGMSIIREDEGNLDAAIYHMERAFEVKPSNSAIQEELRRLYGRRDGITPPRVRLTRGALVRMYTRGELYPQAIAEIRASLAEDPKRVDLEVILARIYMILGRKAEAIEVCSRLVSKLPNCLEANRILADVLPGTSRAEDAEAYRQQVIALDPYSANITSNAPTSAEVPDNAILIDFLEYQPSQQASQQPEWAKSVGVDLQQPEEAIPDWLAEKPAAQGTGLPEPLPPLNPLAEVVTPPQPPTQQVSVAPPAEPVQAAVPEPSEHEALIPDWMKNAGWTESSSASVEEKETLAPSGEAPEEIAQAELPDWLKAIAPTQEPETTPAEGEKEDLAKLDQLLSAQPQEVAKPEEIAPVEQAAPSEIVVPLQEPQPAVELPAWMEEPPVSQAPTAEAQPVPQEEVPDWLAGLNIPSEAAPVPTETAPAEAAPAEELPDWLKTFASETPAEVNAAPVSETSPDWLKDLQAKTEPAPTEEAPVSETHPQPEEPMPDWLKGLGEEIPAVPTVAAIPVEPEAITPETQPELTSTPIEAAQTSAPEAITPEPIPEMTAAPVEAAQATEPEVKPVEVAAEEPAAKTQPVAVKKIGPTAEETPSESVTPIVAETPALESVAAEKTPEDSINSALAWLESLAAQQGADQATLLVPPEQRTATPPEWIQKEIESAKAAAQKTTAEVEAATPPAAESQPVPSAEPEVSVPVAEQLPTAEEVPQPAPVEKIEQPAEAVTPAVEVPTEEIPTQEAIPAEEIGAPRAIAPEEMDLDSAFAWLKSLAARQGVEPETLSVPPEKQPEQPPAWIQQAVAEGETKPAIEVPEPAAEIPPAMEAIPSRVAAGRSCFAGRTACPARSIGNFTPGSRNTSG